MVLEDLGRTIPVARWAGVTLVALSMSCAGNPPGRDADAGRAEDVADSDFPATPDSRDNDVFVRPDLDGLIDSPGDATPDPADVPVNDGFDISLDPLAGDGSSDEVADIQDGEAPDEAPDSGSETKDAELPVSDTVADASEQDDAAEPMCRTMEDCQTLFGPPLVCRTRQCVRGTCIDPMLPDLTPCDPEDACILSASCHGGLCLPDLLRSCEDFNDCTVDSCDPILACIHAGTKAWCDDGNYCTTYDSCATGRCVGSPHGGCTCVTTLNCAPWDDSDLCNGTLACVDGHCVVDSETVVACEPPPDIQCARVTCRPETGKCLVTAIHEGGACVGADRCRALGTCQQGICVEGPTLPCDDENPCTANRCDPDIGCIFDPGPGDCSDRNPCTTEDTCRRGTCDGNPIVCSTPPGPCMKLPGTCVAGECQYARIDGGSCGPEATCVAGDCVPCGTGGTPCCPGDACQEGTTCSGGRCESCGEEIQPCCNGRQCQSGLDCTSGRCLTTASPCVPGERMCVPGGFATCAIVVDSVETIWSSMQSCPDSMVWGAVQWSQCEDAGICKQCGDASQPCCADRGCQQGMECNDAGSCVNCGERGSACCRGGVCEAWAYCTSEGKCAACGANGYPCCPNGLCWQTNQCDMDANTCFYCGLSSGAPCPSGSCSWGTDFDPVTGTCVCRNECQEDGDICFDRETRGWCRDWNNDGCLGWQPHTYLTPGVVCWQGDWCFPNCLEAACGDDGCGGSCGQCDIGERCTARKCCAPHCVEGECGTDGCGGSCGICLMSS